MRLLFRKPETGAVRRRQRGTHVAPLARLAGLMLLCCAGCGGRGPEAGPRVAVQGNVTLDGQPVSQARIIFVNNNADVIVKATAIIEDGFYEIGGDHGPVVGENTVHIRPEQIDLAEFESKRGDDKTAVPKVHVVDIPTIYQRGKRLKAEVHEEGDNQFDYELVTKK